MRIILNQNVAKILAWRMEEDAWQDQPALLAVIPIHIGMPRRLRHVVQNHVTQMEANVKRGPVAMRVVIPPPTGLPKLLMHVEHAGPMVQYAVVVVLPVMLAVAAALIGTAKVSQHAVKNLVGPMGGYVTSHQLAWIAVIPKVIGIAYHQPHAERVGLMVPYAMHIRRVPLAAILAVIMKAKMPMPVEVAGRMVPNVARERRVIYVAMTAVIGNANEREHAEQNDLFH